jgi:hypothetical protein
MTRRVSASPDNLCNAVLVLLACVTARCSAGVHQPPLPMDAIRAPLDQSLWRPAEQTSSNVVPRARPQLPEWIVTALSAVSMAKCASPTNLACAAGGDDGSGQNHPPGDNHSSASHRLLPASHTDGPPLLWQRGGVLRLVSAPPPASVRAPPCDPGGSGGHGSGGDHDGGNDDGTAQQLTRDLLTLGELLERGVLSASEFGAAKSRAISQHLALAATATAATVGGAQGGGHPQQPMEAAAEPEPEPELEPGRQQGRLRRQSWVWELPCAGEPRPGIHAFTYGRRSQPCMGGEGGRRHEAGAEPCWAHESCCAAVAGCFRAVFDGHVRMHDRDDDDARLDYSQQVRPTPRRHIMPGCAVGARVTHNIAAMGCVHRVVFCRSRSCWCRISGWAATW